MEVNCATLAPSFLETELFGHEEGPSRERGDAVRDILKGPTGAHFFLDEIGLISIEVQEKSSGG